ncbi:MAG: hypothetical protein SGBAC_012544 [Bacillariaceae sp.]
MESSPIPQEIPASISSRETAYEDFHRQGYIILPEVLNPTEIEELKSAIDKQSDDTRDKKMKKKKRHAMFKRVFEEHPTLCLKVFKNETVLPVVRGLINHCGSARGHGDPSLEAHIIHNNAFRMDPGMRGQAPKWHTDDPPLFQTHNGEPLPESVKIAPLVVTCMFFLNDLNTPEDGGTRIIERSHRFGVHCSEEEAMKHPHAYVQAPAGSALIFSAHTWHKGAAVADTAPNPRYVFQATYGRRLVGHKHDTIMNYVLPESVEQELESEEDKKLMGFLQGGAYS